MFAISLLCKGSLLHVEVEEQADVGQCIPDRLVRSILQGRPTTTSTRSTTVTEGPAPKLLFLLYIAGVTEWIECVCRPLGIQVLCGYRGKMREALVKVKQPTPELDKKGVAYEVPCGECNHVYISEMGRTLRKRLTKYMWQ